MNQSDRSAARHGKPCLAIIEPFYKSGNEAPGRGPPGQIRLHGLQQGFGFRQLQNVNQ